MKKLRKNKFLVIIISVITVCIVYFVTQNAIDNYVFNTNSDIVIEESSNNGAEDSTTDDKGNASGDLGEKVGQISNEEVDFVLEEAEKNEDDSDKKGESSVGEASDNNSADEEKDKASSEESKIYVYITGEVNNPGVVILNEGSRIVDAINAAGGTTSKANVSKVNLVYVLEDGMKVNIPNNNDLKNNSDFEYITMNSGDGGKEDYSNNNTSSNNSSAESNSSSNSKNYGIVNINTATQTELETLPGIGPSLALKIINYRKENGKFFAIEEIKNVSGIGENKFEELKQYITV